MNSRSGAPLRALALVAVLCLGVLASGCGDEGPKPDPVAPGERSHDPAAPQFGQNAVRIPGLSPEDVAAAALLAVYPPGEDASPRGWVLYPGSDWHLGLLAAQFAGDPVNGGVLPTRRGFFPTPIADVMGRFEPEGFPRGSGLQTILLGDPGHDVIADVQAAKLQLTQLAAPPAELAAKLTPYRGGYAETYSDSVVVVSAEQEAIDYALIAAAWSAFSGDTIAFVDESGVPEATQQILAQREDLTTRQPTIYVLGPPRLVSDSVLGELGAYGEAKRIPGQTPAAAAVEFARYLDPSTGFGFGIARGPASFTLVNTEHDWQDAYAGIILAGAGPRAPILPVDDAERLPAPVRDYLGGLGGGEPSQAFVLGDTRGISSGLLEELDELLEASGSSGGGASAGRKS